MGEVTGIIIALGLYIGAVDQKNPTVHDHYIDASRTAWDAGYEQSGLKKMVDKRMQDLEKKYVPKEVEKYGSATAIVIKVIVQKQLTLTWSF